MKSICKIEELRRQPLEDSWEGAFSECHGYNAPLFVPFGGPPNCLWSDVGATSIRLSLYFESGGPPVKCCWLVWRDPVCSSLNSSHKWEIGCRVYCILCKRSARWLLWNLILASISPAQTHHLANMLTRTLESRGYVAPPVVVYWCLSSIEW